MLHKIIWNLRVLHGKLHENNEKLKKILSLIVFISIALFAYTRVTYLFREVSCSRDTITGFEEEEKLDVVCIGFSTIV